MSAILALYAGSLECSHMRQRCGLIAPRRSRRATVLRWMAVTSPCRIAVSTRRSSVHSLASVPSSRGLRQASPTIWVRASADTTGGRPARGRSRRLTTPPLRTRLTQRRTVLRARPVCRAKPWYVAPSATASTRLARRTSRYCAFGVRQIPSKAARSEGGKVSAGRLSATAACSSLGGGNGPDRDARLGCSGPAHLQDLEGREPPPSI